MSLIKVKGKGQMTIPAEIRNTLKLTKGDVPVIDTTQAEVGLACTATALQIK